MLPEPVTLLRAVAKVEVILKTDEHFDLSFSEVKIHRYNKKGYCAPKDVFRRTITIIVVSGTAITLVVYTLWKMVTMWKKNTRFPLCKPMDGYWRI